jgi:hypothetical protein
VTHSPDINRITRDDDHNIFEEPLGNISTTGVACEAGYAYHFAASVITSGLFLLNLLLI